MGGDDGHEIPAAGIGDTDLAALSRTNPVAAKEIARLRDLMDLGEESKAEFLQLCQLLFDVGSVSASEYLLRRNLEYYDDRALYIRLFGTARQDEFDAAIESFKSQFDLVLVLERENDFLVTTFRTDGGPPRSDTFELLSRPCEIKFGYIQQDTIQADVTLLDPGREVFYAGEWFILFFVNGVWELADSLEG